MESLSSSPYRADDGAVGEGAVKTMGVESTGTGVVVRPVGRMDHERAGALRTVLTHLVDTGERDIVIDLGRVEEFDGVGVGVVIAAHRRLRGLGGSLSLRSPSPYVRGVLDVLNAKDLVTVTAEA